MTFGMDAVDISYQIGVFTTHTATSVKEQAEEQANGWLRVESIRRKFRILTTRSTDVVQLSADAGKQRQTLAITYEQSDCESRDLRRRLEGRIHPAQSEARPWAEDDNQHHST